MKISIDKGFSRLNYFICVLFSALFVFQTQAQCTYSSVSSDSFEYTTTCPNLISGTVYHLAPQTYAAHTGLRSIYMNFVNNLASNTVVYSRQYTVCANQTYRINAWFKQTFSGSSTITLRIKSSTGTTLSTNTNTYTAGAWSQWVSSAFIPTTGTITFDLIYTSGFGGNDLSMDDLELELCVPPTITRNPIEVCTAAPQFNLLDSLAAPISAVGVWSGPSALLNGALGAFDAATMTGGLYEYTIAGSPAVCPDSVWAVNVIVNNGPNINMGEDTTLCYGTGLLLDATSANATYVWQDQSTSATFLATQPGTYWVTAMSNGCTSSDTIVVDFYPADLVDFGNDTALCEKEVLVLDATLLGASYLWQDQSTNPTFSVTIPGTYWVSILANGCADADTIVVDFKPLPIVNLGPDTLVCAGLPYVLDATFPNASYAWSNGSTSATFEVNVPGDYWVEVTLNGCTKIDTVAVTHKDCEVILEMPNVFTPNNDGTNDYFEPVTFVRVNNFSIQIYNRWGSIVHDYSGSALSWDGKDMEGQDLSAGVYFYLINYEDVYGNAYQQNGEVTLFR